MKTDYLFFVSCRYLARTYTGHHSTWNRNINIYVLLGLINKHSYDDLSKSIFKRRINRERKMLEKKYGYKEDELREINVYSIPLYTEELLSRADNIAKQMIEKGFQVSGFSKIWIIKAFDKETANKVFNDDRDVTEYSDYIVKEIEDYILKDIDINGYTKKQRVIDNVIINHNKVTTQEYGFLKQIENPKSIIEREFSRSFEQIKRDNGLEYKRPTKEYKEKHNLESYKWVIRKIN